MIRKYVTIIKIQQVDAPNATFAHVKLYIKSATL